MIKGLIEDFKTLYKYEGEVKVFFSPGKSKFNWRAYRL